MSILKTRIAAAITFVSALGLRPIWSTKNTEGQPATLGKEAEEILNGNFSALEEEVGKKADETKAIDGKLLSVVRNESGSIPDIDLSPYARTTTPDGTVIRTPDGLIPTVDISSKVDKKIIYNVTQTTGVTYTDKQTARNAVPTSLRGIGQIITYKLTTTGWITEHYIGVDVNGWATAANWRVVGEVSVDDMKLKADKKLESGYPVTYLKSIDVDSDLTTELRASIRPAIIGVYRWLDGQRNTNIANLADPTTDPNGGYVATIKLKANTTYEMSGLGSFFPNMTTPVATDETNTVTITNAITRPPALALYPSRADGSITTGNAAKCVQPPYNSKFRFTTDNTNLWLGLYVQLRGTFRLHRNGVDYIFVEAAFDSRETITLKEAASRNSYLTDSEGTVLKDISLNSFITEDDLTQIKGISDGSESINPNIISEEPYIQAGFTIDSSGEVFKHAGANPGAFGSIGDYIPVEGSVFYDINFKNSVRSGTFNDTSGVPHNYRGYNYYDADKNFIPGININVDGFYTPANARFVRMNVSIPEYVASRPHVIKKGNPPKSEDELKVSIDSASLSDAVEFQDGIKIPKLYISSSNVIDGGGGDDELKISMRNVNTFVGSFNTIIDKIQAVKPKARHVFISHFTYDGTAGNGYLRKLIATQKAMCENRSIPFINLADIMALTNNPSNVVDGVDYNNLFKWSSDGTHPGVDDGSQALANILTFALIEKLRPIFAGSWNGKIVANIGDSVSAGYSWNGTHQGWARYIQRAIVALGGVVKLYANSGGALRKFTTDNTPVNPSFMNEEYAVWNYQKDILDKIGTADEPDLYVWELGHNDYTNDERDFKLKW